MEVVHILLAIVVAAVASVLFYMQRRLTYWERRNVVNDKPSPFFGNLREFGKTKPLNLILREFYTKYKSESPIGGYYFFMRQAVMLFDLDLIKTVLIKDFSNFSHRGNYYNERDDPLSGHLFNLDGSKWRSLRAKLTPTFTSGKMKFMLPTLVNVAENFMSVFREVLQEINTIEKDGESVVEVKEFLARYTTDVIGSCAFGIDCNSLKFPNAQFRLMGKKAFDKRRHGRSLIALMTAYPDFFRKLGFKLVDEDVNQFFMKVVKDTIHYREENNIQRNDFLNLLIELKNEKNEDTLSIEEIAAQAFVFFLAGFETSSSTMSFALYELAQNPDIQDKARSEINETLDRHNGEFSYEAIYELKYLRKILNETLRFYSIASLLLRKTINDYKVPGTDHVIEKGILVIVPVDAIHHDPEIYSNPEVFDPERFDSEEVHKRHPMAWLPFGDGPRNCIGMRFGEMQALVGLAMLLKNFKFSISDRTEVPIVIDKKNPILSSKDGILLHVTNL